MVICDLGIFVLFAPMLHITLEHKQCGKDSSQQDGDISGTQLRSFTDEPFPLEMFCIS
jgi:hypothetical protein